MHLAVGKRLLVPAIEIGGEQPRIYFSDPGHRRPIDRKVEAADVQLPGIAVMSRQTEDPAVRQAGLSLRTGYCRAPRIRTISLRETRLRCSRTGSPGSSRRLRKAPWPTPGCRSGRLRACAPSPARAPGCRHRPLRFPDRPVHTRHPARRRPCSSLVAWAWDHFRTDRRQTPQRTGAS